MLVFSAIATGFGLLMIVRPTWFRTHESFDWLNDANLAALGGVVVAVAILRALSDAWLLHYARAIGCSAFAALYLCMAMGVLLYDPSPSLVSYTGLCAVETLLALRRI